MPGDILHSPLQARYPELSPRFDFDGDVAAKTRRSSLNRYCDTQHLMLHGSFPVAIDRANHALGRWVSLRFG
jgi:hypothetical protein